MAHKMFRKIILFLLLNTFVFGGQLKPPKGMVLSKGKRWSTDGLVGFWPMPEGSGNKTFDLSGNGNTGTFVSGATWTSGKFGFAANFPTAGDYVNCGASTLLKMGLSNWSGIVWAKITTSQAIQTLYEGGALSPTEQGWHFRYDTSAGEMLFVISNGSDRTNYDSDNSLGGDDGEWHQFGFSIVRSGNITFYFDGQPVGTKDVSARDGQDIQGTQDLCIGSNNSTFDLIGHVDSALLYNRALSTSIMVQLYRNPFIMFQPEPPMTYKGSVAAAAAPAAQVIFISSVPLFLIFGCVLIFRKAA